MKRTIIESPFAGNENHSEKDHRRYLERCIRDSIERGESPYASHKMLTDALDDSIPSQRAKGIEAGYAWHEKADKIVFYVDYGMSKGMKTVVKMYDKYGYFEKAFTATFSYTFYGLDGIAMEVRRIGKNATARLIMSCTRIDVDCPKCGTTTKVIGDHDEDFAEYGAVKLDVECYGCGYHYKKLIEEPE